MLRLVVFDCDGVMFDSREANRIYYNDLLSAFDYPPMDETELAYVHMHHVTDSVNFIFRNHHSQNMAEVHRYRAELDYTPYLSHMIMEPDLVTFLDNIQPYCKLAISTNRSTTMLPLLERFELSCYFQMVVTSQDVKNPKPAPDALLEILGFFDCPASEAIYIGDSIVDRQHTAAAGVSLIAFKNPELPAEYHVNSFTEILQLPPFVRIIEQDILICSG